MTATNVRLQTEGTTGIEYGHIPYSRSVYWSAPHEEFMPAVEVFMTQGAYLRCCAHAGSDLEREGRRLGWSGSFGRITGPGGSLRSSNTRFRLHSQSKAVHF